MKLIKYCTWMFLTLVLVACNTIKTPQTKAKNCDTTGIVKDFSELDGCKLLIKTEKGILLRPAELPDGIYLKAEQKIKFAYEEMPEIMSICMRERMTVRVTCLKVLP